MKIKPIVEKKQMELALNPHMALRVKAAPIIKIDAEIKRIADDMLALMYEGHGMGLAGNQVNYPYQIIVVNPTASLRRKDMEYIFINPTILHRRRGTDVKMEGCLSLPGDFGMVRRAKEIELHAYTITGGEIRQKFRGDIARTIQHECDHLRGVLFVDKLEERA